MPVARTADTKTIERAPRAGAPAGTDRPETGHLARRAVILAVALALVGANIVGAQYYLAPQAVRVRHSMHVWLKPSGYIGQGLGLLAAALFLFLWLYPLRKKYGARFPFAGRIAEWLDWHVAAGLLVPWLAATHAGWRFTGLIGLGYAAMFIVFLSGLVGRYFYTRIPRRRDGLELSRNEIAAERERALFEFTAATRLPPDTVRGMLTQPTQSCEGLGVFGTLRRLAADDWSRRKAARRIARQISSRQEMDRSTLRDALRLARREMALSQQLRMLNATQRIFRYWHAAHKPVAVTALLAVLTHIVVAVLMGATWFN